MRGHTREWRVLGWLMWQGEGVLQGVERKKDGKMISYDLDYELLRLGLISLDKDWVGLDIDLVVKFRIWFDLFRIRI